MEGSGEAWGQGIDTACGSGDLEPRRYFTTQCGDLAYCLLDAGENVGQSEHHPARLEEPGIEDALAGLRFGRYFWVIHATLARMGMEVQRVGTGGVVQPSFVKL